MTIDPRVGLAWLTRPFTINTGAVEGFAQITGENHPIHLDAPYAETTPFGGTIVQGMLVLSTALGHLHDGPTAVLALVGLKRVRFKRPVRPGEELHAECCVEAARRVAAGTLVALRCTIVQQDGRTAVDCVVELLLDAEAGTVSDGAIGDGC